MYIKAEGECSCKLRASVSYLTILCVVSHVTLCINVNLVLVIWQSCVVSWVKLCINVSLFSLCSHRPGI
uniref:Uncharacterized protein n=1 Tax=Arundo donax TaxID=35708 RepID=A0A0A9HLU4_ARUDO